MSAIGTKRTFGLRRDPRDTYRVARRPRPGVSDGECLQDQVRWLDCDYLRGPAANENSLRLFHLVMLSHALPIHLNFSVAPNIFQIFA
jgi:hypothetical protein